MQAHQILQKAHPEVYRWLLQHPGAQVSPLYLEQAKSGDMTCYRNEGNKKQYLYSRYQPRKVDLNLSSDCDSVLLVGLGLGFELQLASRHGVVWVYEPNPHVWRLFLQLEENLPLLENPSIHFAVTPEMLPAAAPSMQIVESAMVRHFRESYSALYRILSKDSRRILMYAYPVFASPLHEALLDLGYGSHLLPWRGEGPALEDVKRVRPACIFSVNAHPGIAAFARTVGIPFFSWTIDSPSFHLFDPRNNHNLALHFCYDKELTDFLQRQGMSRVVYLPPATQIPTIEDEDTPIDISFVGNVAFDQNLWSLYQKALPKSLYTFLDDVMETLSHDDIGGNPAVILEAVTWEGRPIWESLWHYVGPHLEELLYISPRERVVSHLSKEISRRFRLKVMKQVVATFGEDYRVHIYGNEAWAKDPLLASYYQGNLDAGGMARVFRQSKINLNFIQPQAGNWAMPMRIYDVLGSKGFLLSNYRPALELEFVPGKHLAIFQDDWREMIDYFLNHPKERISMATEGYSKVAQKDTFYHRARRIIECLQEHGFFPAET